MSRINNTLEITFELKNYKNSFTFFKEWKSMWKYMKDEIDISLRPRDFILVVYRILYLLALSVESFIQFLLLFAQFYIPLTATYWALFGGNDDNLRLMAETAARTGMLPTKNVTQGNFTYITIESDLDIFYLSSLSETVSYHSSSSICYLSFCEIPQDRDIFLSQCSLQGFQIDSLILSKLFQANEVIEQAHCKCSFHPSDTLPKF